MGAAVAVFAVAGSAQDTTETKPDTQKMEKRWGKRGKLVPIRINSRGDRRYKKEAVLWLLGMQAKTE